MKALIIYNPSDRANGKGIAIAIKQGSYVDHGSSDTLQVFEADLDQAEYDRLIADPRIQPIATDADIDKPATDTDVNQLDQWLAKQGVPREIIDRGKSERRQGESTRRDVGVYMGDVLESMRRER